VPRFLDVHTVEPGTSLEVVAEAHQRDLAIQDKYDVRYVKYWYDAVSGKIFCLSEAPSKEAALAVHREAHGHAGTPDEIFEVQESE
jgi:hypothetical protein